MPEAIFLAPFAKEKAQEIGELSQEQLIQLYLDEVCDVKGDFELKEFTEINPNKFNLNFNYKAQEFDMTEKGTGPLDACINALKKAGFTLVLENYEQYAVEGLDESKEKSKAMSVLQFKHNNQTLTARSVDTSTPQANVRAVFNALNLIYTN